MLTTFSKTIIIQEYDNSSRENTMFEAALLVCLAAAPEECVELDDTKGPYTTEAACKQRADEMAAFATSANLFELNIKWKCSAPKGLQT